MLREHGVHDLRDHRVVVAHDAGEDRLAGLAACAAGCAASPRGRRHACPGRRPGSAGRDTLSSPRVRGWDMRRDLLFHYRGSLSSRGASVCAGRDPQASRSAAQSGGDRDAEAPGGGDQPLVVARAARPSGRARAGTRSTRGAGRRACAPAPGTARGPGRGRSAASRGARPAPRGDAPLSPCEAPRPRALSRVHSSYSRRRLADERLLPRASPAGGGPRPGGARARPTCRGRSPVPAVRVELAASSSQVATGCRGGGPSATTSGAVIQPSRTASARRASASSGARPGRGGPSSATTRSRSVTSTVSPLSARRTYSLSLFFRTLTPTALMAAR